MLTKPQVFYDNNLKQTLGFQNHFYLKKAQQIRPMLYDGTVIAKKTNVISIDDSEETLMLEEESRSKMILKQSDPIVLEKKCLLDETTEVQTIFNQMEEAVEQYHIVNIVVNSFVDINDSVNVNVKSIEMCNKCLELKVELIKQHNMVEKDEYNKLSNAILNLNSTVFLLNLQSELQEKDTTIKKLKAHIKRVNETSTSESVKMDIDEIETINIELEHRVAKLIAENKHLKQTYKQLNDSIKPSRVRSKEHSESLVNQLNQKSVKITDLNAQLQKKVFVSIKK
ncbi:hypothetical protein Tco_0227809 [Tanacetum coccineum]